MGEKFKEKLHKTLESARGGAMPLFPVPERLNQADLY